MRARIDGVMVSTRNEGRRGCGGGRNQPGAAGAIMVITREHVHYGAAVSTGEARLGAARFRLGPLLPLAYFASARETTTRASATRLQPGCGADDDRASKTRETRMFTRTFDLARDSQMYAKHQWERS